MRQINPAWRVWPLSNPPAPARGHPKSLLGDPGQQGLGLGGIPLGCPRDIAGYISMRIDQESDGQCDQRKQVAPVVSAAEMPYFWSGSA